MPGYALSRIEVAGVVPESAKERCGGATCGNGAARQTRKSAPASPRPLGYTNPRNAWRRGKDAYRLTSRVTRMVTAADGLGMAREVMTLHRWLASAQQEEKSEQVEKKHFQQTPPRRHLLRVAGGKVHCRRGPTPALHTRSIASCSGCPWRTRPLSQKNMTAPRPPPDRPRPCPLLHLLPRAQRPHARPPGTAGLCRGHARPGSGHPPAGRPLGCGRRRGDRVRQDAGLCPAAGGAPAAAGGAVGPARGVCDEREGEEGADA